MISYKDQEFRSPELTKLAQAIFGEDILEDVFFCDKVAVDASGEMIDNTYNKHIRTIWEHAEYELAHSSEDEYTIGFDSCNLHVVLKNGRSFQISSSEWGNITRLS